MHEMEKHITSKNNSEREIHRTEKLARALLYTLLTWFSELPVYSQLVQDPANHCPERDFHENHVKEQSEPLRVPNVSEDVLLDPENLIVHTKPVDKTIR